MGKSGFYVMIAFDFKLKTFRLGCCCQKDKSSILKISLFSKSSSIRCCSPRSGFISVTWLFFRKRFFKDKSCPSRLTSQIMLLLKSRTVKLVRESILEERILIRLVFRIKTSIVEGKHQMVEIWLKPKFTLFRYLRSFSSGISCFRLFSERSSSI